MNATVKKAWEFYAQSEYFIQAAKLVSEDAKENKHKHPVAYNNFEGVIVGTHHAFSAEILLKGYMLLKTGTFEEGHFIDELLNTPSCSELKVHLREKYESQNSYAYSQADYESGIEEFLENLDLTVSRERKTSEKVKATLSQNEFGTFEYFLQLHSNNFVLMRYVCERSPLPVDINFTSFLVGGIRDKYKLLLESSEIC